MKYFSNCTTLPDLKKEYRRLVMLHHPDRGGDLETMKAINIEYSECFEVLKHQHNANADESHRTTEVPEEFICIVNALVKLPGLIVELCGSWLWISGDTLPNREALKAAGCRWSSSKKMWYWRHAEDSSYRIHGKRSIQEIRSKYGSKILHSAASSALEA